MAATPRERGAPGTPPPATPSPCQPGGGRRASQQLHTPLRGTPLALRSSPAAPLPSDFASHLVSGEGLADPAEQSPQEGGSEPCSSRIAEAEQHSGQPRPEASTSPAPPLPRPLP